MAVIASGADFLGQLQQPVPLEHELADKVDQFVQLANIHTHALGSERLRRRVFLLGLHGGGLFVWPRFG